ncbi:unnamed protein product [Fraxinus pennsylvanica]|uniref:RuvB-like helicase n=1 Tax=Fraxinus pennsylvanica TaxID=56036 RepID=A0AAD1YVZ7_9LAMI|nr:unnamed protein product [Fraxinus pennsylvanica]
MGVAKSLGQDTLYAMQAANCIRLRSKTEALMQALGKVISFKIEKTDVIEGEVVEIRIERERLLSDGWAASRTGKLTLKTTEMEMACDLGATIIETLEKEKVQVRTVLQSIRPQGRSHSSRGHSRGLWIMMPWAMGPQTKFVQCPEGELQKKKKVVHCITLHEINVFSNRILYKTHSESVVNSWREEDEREEIAGGEERDEDLSPMRSQFLQYSVRLVSIALLRRGACPYLCHHGCYQGVAHPAPSEKWAQGIT